MHSFSLHTMVGILGGHQMTQQSRPGNAFVNRLGWHRSSLKLQWYAVAAKVLGSMMFADKNRSGLEVQKLGDFFTDFDAKMLTARTKFLSFG